MAYQVTWTIDIEDADNPEKAARKALSIQRDPCSMATVFTVIDDETGAAWKVDLDAELENRVTRIVVIPK